MPFPRQSGPAESRWSYVALGAGSLAVIGGAGFLIWNAGEKSDAEDAFNDYAADVNPTDGSCGDACVETLGILVDDLDEKWGRDVYGWIGVGVGAAVIGGGALLYLLGDEPDRYDPKPESDVIGSLRLDVSPAGARACRGRSSRGIQATAAGRPRRGAALGKEKPSLRDWVSLRARKDSNLRLSVP